MCGMMAMQMQGGLGYDDLNDLLKVIYVVKYMVFPVQIQTILMNAI